MPRPKSNDRPLDVYHVALDPALMAPFKSECALDSIPMRTMINILIAQWCKERGRLPQESAVWLAPLSLPVRDPDIPRLQRKYYRDREHGYEGTFQEWRDAECDTVRPGKAAV
jgi:hypothetical protein